MASSPIAQISSLSSHCKKPHFITINDKTLPHFSSSSSSSSFTSKNTHLFALSENGAGSVAATTTPAAADEGLVTGSVKFENPKWVNGTWDLAQFLKDGKTIWDAVIDAGRAAMVGFFMAYFVDSLTRAGLVDQMGNFFCKMLLLIAVSGVFLIGENVDVEKLKKLIDETTFHDKQGQATWQDETTGKSKRE